MRRREFLAGSAALAAVSRAEALTVPQKVSVLGGANSPPAGQSFVTETDTNSVEQFISVTGANGVEQSLAAFNGAA